MSSSNAYGERISSLEYWQNNRQSVTDLYESERYFFEPIVKQIETVLDVGCAAGGFYNITREINSKIRYTGVDISPELINISKHRFPGIDFITFNGELLPFLPDSFDIVYCF